MAVQMRCAAAGAPSDQGPDGGLGGAECGPGRGMINSVAPLPRPFGDEVPVTVRGAPGRPAAPEPQVDLVAVRDRAESRTGRR